MLSKTHSSLISKIDLPSVICYLLLVIVGWFAISGATHTYESTSLVEWGTRPMMQLVWIGCSLGLVVLVMTIDDTYYSTLAPIIYVAFMLLLLATIFLSRDIKGSRSWLEIGPISVQPAEFAKVATALMLASIVGQHDFRLSSWRSYATVLGVILLPMMLIVLQKETGSALVYTAFFLALYREGLSGYLLGGGFLAIVIFVAALSLSGVEWGFTEADLFMVLTIVLLATLFFLFRMKLLSHQQRRAMLWILLVGYLGAYLVEHWVSFNWAWLAGAYLGALLIFIVVRLVRTLHPKLLVALVVAVGALIYAFSVSIVYEKVLQPHQQNRIAVALGMKEDLRGVGYNVHQAKIAIGSGGLWGKGFLKGTQTKLNYVPEQDTDFIFCTIGEEQGFVGATLLLCLYLALLLRIIVLAERQESRFARFYGYAVVSVLLFHITINIGMVIGLFPVIGIPLPFLSYGGSSLWSFTIMLFLFLRMDASQRYAKAMRHESRRHFLA